MNGYLCLTVISQDGRTNEMGHLSNRIKALEVEVADLKRKLTDHKHDSQAYSLCGGYLSRVTAIKEMIDLLMLGDNVAIPPEVKFWENLLMFGSFGLLAFLLLWAMIAIRIEEKSEEREKKQEPEELDTFTKEESNEATIQTKKDTSRFSVKILVVWTYIRVVILCI